MTHRAYLIHIFILAGLLISGTYLLTLWLEPLYGDLARIGGYAERNFGGNAPMLEFKPLAASWGEDYRPADVLVIGDSFANLRPAQQWQNWLAARTGWTIHTLDVNRLDLDALLTNDLYRRHPPRVVIWNVIERDLLNEYGTGDGNCTLAAPHPQLAAHPLQPIDYAPHKISRLRGLADLNPGFSRSWLWKNLLRDSIGLDYSGSLSLPLARRDLFTSLRADQLLIFTRDLGKAKWRVIDLERIRCGFRNLATRFEANGKTRFLTALAPDKSSAYRPWLVNPDSLPASHLSALLKKFPVSDARIDIALEKAIASGTQDVYMPDDTHWGSAGHRLAAEAILRTLTDEGLTR